ncbi:hypothetical protein P9112_000895 [Eukaryota sp. TZLM1-RC]
MRTYGCLRSCKPDNNIDRSCSSPLSDTSKITKSSTTLKQKSLLHFFRKGVSLEHFDRTRTNLLCSNEPVHPVTSSNEAPDLKQMFFTRNFAPPTHSKEERSIAVSGLHLSTLPQQPAFSSGNFRLHYLKSNTKVSNSILKFLLVVNKSLGYPSEDSTKFDVVIATTMVDSKSFIVGAVLFSYSVESYPLSCFTSKSTKAEFKQTSIGVDRMFVVEKYRRQGLCSKMLIYIKQLTRQTLISFSQPTADGLALAKSFTGTCDVLVYGELSSNDTV